MKFNLIRKGNKLVGSCPVHAGDNKTAFNVWMASGIWVCRTHKCHEVFGKHFDDLIRGLISRQHYSWPSSLNEATLSDVERFKKNDLVIDSFEDFELIEERVEFNPLSLETFLSDKLFPCPFYKKKFDESICKKHYISYVSKGPMACRSVVPIFDQEKKNVIGWQGRSIFEQCGNCGGFHDKLAECGKYNSPKWKFSMRCPSSKTLYNIWNMPETLERVFLTESIGNVLRLEEFNISNAVATFGTQFSKDHEKQLLDKGVKQIIYLKDSGAPGQEIADKIKKNKKFNVVVPSFDIPDDIAACDKDCFREKVLLIIKGYK